MLTTAIFELVQQFYHATEMGNNADSHRNLIFTFWPICNVSWNLHAN